MKQANELCEKCLWNDENPEICNKGGAHKKTPPSSLDPVTCIEGFCLKSEYDKWPEDRRDQMAEECGKWWKRRRQEELER